MRNIEIDLNSDEISDVICCPYWADENGPYLNCMTGKEGNGLRSVIRPEKRFIITHKYPDRDSTEGVYVKYLPDIDRLVIVTALFRYVDGKAMWKKNATIYIDKTMGGELAEHVYIPLSAVDICGQAIVASNGEFDNAFVGAKLEAQKYFHSPFIVTLDSKEKVVSGLVKFSSINDLKYLIDICDEYATVDERGQISCGGVFYGENADVKKDISFDAGLLPKEFEKRLKSIAEFELINRFNNAKKGGTFLNPDRNVISLCCLQNMNGKCMQRFFYVDYTYNYDKNSVFKNCFISKTQFQFIEYQRVEIAKDLCFSNQVMRGVVIYRDNDVDEWLLKYQLHYIDSFIKYVSKSLGLSFAGIAKKSPFWEYFLSDYKVNVDAHNLHPKNIVLACYEIATCPLLEKIANLDYDEEKIVFYAIARNIINYGNTALDAITDVLGDVDINQKNINKALGIPSGMLQYAIQNSISLDNIKKLKDIFGGTEESRQYFLRINKKEAGELLHWMEYELPNSIKATKASRTLIKLFGAKNWNGYFEHIYSMHWDRCADEYYEYVNCLDEIGDAAKKADWRVSEDGLKKAKESIMAAYCAYVDKAQYSKYVEKFKKFSSAWEKYAYESLDYMVTYPKAPSDLVYEGFALNHCVKDFIKDVAIGTTTILFIRKSANPDKPYFTLEITDKKIRQCHGNCNRRIYDEDASLYTFIQRFCKERNVEYAVGEDCLGPLR